MIKRIAVTALALLGVAGTAGASPLVLPSNTPIFFTFSDLEEVNLANNLVVPGYAPAVGTQGNWAVFNVSTVQSGAITNPHIDIGGGPVFFSDDGPGGSQGQITAILYGVQNLAPGVCAAAGAPACSTGGTVDLFWHDASTDTITASCLSGITCLPDAATVAQFTTGTFLARLNIASGINSANGTIFTQSNADPSTLGGSGHADSFANVNLGTVGAWTASLNGDWFNTAFGTRDIRLSNFFNVDVASWTSLGAPIPGDGLGTCATCLPGTAGLRSNDPGRVLTAETIPEPATLTLLGLGLAGVAARRRKKA